jgi:type II secretory ATPase GspE/PulE/Tfp pilus assembly ATPase PilB-like protein
VQCLRTGYRGRTGIFEFLEMDDELRELVKNKGTAREYREILMKRKIPSLRRAGFEKVLQGVTTVDEVVRVTT